MKDPLAQFAESLDHASKSIQTTAMSAEVATEAMKSCITDAQVLVQEFQKLKTQLKEKEAENSKLQTEIAQCREQNQKLWDENQSIRANLDAANKKYIAEHPSAKKCRELTPEEVARHESEIDPKEAYD